MLFSTSRWLFYLPIANMAEKASSWPPIKMTTVLPVLALNKDGVMTSCSEVLCLQQRWCLWYRFPDSLDSGCSFFFFPLRYVFADVSNRKLASPYPSFLKDPAPWRLRPGPCAAPTLANFLAAFRSRPGWGGGGGIPGPLSLRSALQSFPAPFF